MQVIQLGPYPPPYGGVQANLVAIREHLRRKGVESGVIHLTRHRKTPGGGVYYPRTALGTAWLLFRLRTAILHLHIGGTVPWRVAGLALLCTLTPGRKSVLTFHSGGYPSSAEGRAAKARSLLGFIFRRFDRIIVVNPQLREVFRRFGVEENRLRLILPYAVDLNEMASELPPKLAEFWASHDPVLVTVGLLEVEYDLKLQIDAMRRILEQYPRAGLVIIGSGSLQEELIAYIGSKPYARNILLAGDLSHPHTLRAIHDAACLPRTTLYDGDAVSVREALFLGTPVIATDNGMRPPGVRLIPVSDADALVKAVQNVVREAGARDQRDDQSGRENLEAVWQLYKELTPDAFA